MILILIAAAFICLLTLALCRAAGEGDRQMREALEEELERR